MVNISLSQFLDYTSRISTSAKINAVRSIKNNPEYLPSTDYWKKLRDSIKKMHENDLPVESLKDVLKEVPDAKIKNYSRVISTYTGFIKKNNVKYFSTGRAYWNTEDGLSVGSSPELGLVINGQKYYIKNYYKKKDGNVKVTKRNINSTLTLMQQSQKDFEIEPESKFAVLNLQNGKLIESSKISQGDILELDIEASQFINIWNQV